MKSMRYWIGFLAVAAFSQDLAPDTVTELNKRGTVLHQQARYAEAEALFRRALDIWEPTSPQSKIGHARVLANLGAVLRDLGRYHDAEGVLLKSLQEIESAAGPESPDAGLVLNDLAVLYRVKRDLASAEACALRARRVLTGPQRATNTSILASVYVDQRRFPEAEMLLAQVLQSDPEGPIGTRAHIDLIWISVRRGDCSQAEKQARLAVNCARRVLPPHHPILATALDSLAQVCRLNGNYLEAEQDYRQAIDIWEAGLGPSHPDVARGLMNLAALYHERSREPGAEQLCHRAIGILEQAHGPESPDTLVARSLLSDVLRAERRYAEAERIGCAIMTSLEQALGPEDPRVWSAMVNYARLLIETRRKQEAKALLSRVPRGLTGFR